MIRRSWLKEDDLNQLTDFARGVLSDSNSDGILDTVASPSRTQAWDLDAMGNWQSLSTNGTGQSRTHNAQNQVTGVGSATLAFDANGSMTTDQNGNTFTYDAWNRLVEAVDGSSVTRAEYAYDALGRRIVETRPVASSTDHLYYSTGWQVLEERRGGTSSGDVRRQYLWSIDYVDAMVARVDYASGSVTAKYNVTYDANWNVTAILVNSNSGASIQERYTYDPYGSVTILASDGTVRGSSLFDWKYLHQTGRLDGDTGLYHFRNRDYSPTLGRWTQTDPIGFEAGDTNLYRYVGNGPVSGVDPWGLSKIRIIYKIGKKIVKVRDLPFDLAQKMMRNKTIGRKARKSDTTIFVQVPSCNGQNSAKRFAEEVSPIGRTKWDPKSPEGHPPHYHPAYGISRNGVPKVSGTPHIGDEYIGVPAIGFGISGDDLIDIIVDITPVGDIETIVIDGPKVIGMTQETIEIIMDEIDRGFRLEEDRIKRYFDRISDPNCPPGNPNDPPLTAGGWFPMKH